MPKTVTLSDPELAALQAIRQVVGDSRHPARPAAIAVLDRIATAPEDGPLDPTVARRTLPLVMDDPDNHRHAEIGWTSHWPETDIVIPAGQDLVFGLRRPAGDVLLAWRAEVGDPGHRRSLYRVSFSAFTRPR